METDMLTRNQAAPDFTLPNQHNQPVSLSGFKGKKQVVLYFYPKDDTPGCTIEANQFTALGSAFAALDAVVIGVSKDSCASSSVFSRSTARSTRLLVKWPTSSRVSKNRTRRWSRGTMHSRNSLSP